MARSRATQGNNAQFTYDFGIAIAQSTVNKITRLTGATLTLASAFYALKTSAKEYVDTLKENTLRFGGILSTMRAMEQAQNRLIKGQSYFSMDDQLRGMNQLMSVGVDVRENLEWINKAAHATGKSFSEFSGMITNAINGNLQGLVDAGLMTQRATKMFAKFQGNTIMMQNAIMNFLRSHKGLMNAIKNDFTTIQDGMTRLKGAFKSFFESIIGKPNDPGSLYGTVARLLGNFADKFGKDGVLTENMIALKNYAKGVGVVMTWVVKQVGGVMVWLGKQAKKVATTLLGTSDTFVDRMRSFVVWLEFWKLKILDFFKTYGDEIKGIIKLLLIFKALKYVFVIGGAAIKSVKAYRAALLSTVALQKRYIASMGPFMGKTSKFFQSLAVWLPRPFRRAWVYMGKFFGDFSYRMGKLAKSIISVFAAPFKFIGKGIKFIFRLLRNLPVLIVSLGRGLKALWVALNATNPVGWVILAITLLVTLYNKSEKFRVFINTLFKGIWEFLKLVWNSLAYIFTWAMVGVKKLWGGIKWFWGQVKSFFAWIWDGITSLWDAFMNTKVGKFIDTAIVQPLKGVFEWIVKAWNAVVNGIGKALEWLGLANDTVSKATKDVAEKYGVPKIPTFGGGDYNTNDSTNYLSRLNPFSGSSNNVTEPVENPLLATTPSTQMMSSGGGNSTNMTFGNGAIQIIVQKGEGIDERILAQKVRGVLNDMKREGDMRGGMV